MRTKDRKLHLNKSPSRREFLESAGIAAIASGMGGFGSLLCGSSRAWAQEFAGPETLFIEVNLRDQWDFGHSFVAPGLAAGGAALRRGEGARGTALFFREDELVRAPRTNHILTPQSLALLPHLEDIAVIETAELAIGRIHGHEASNPSRSPGRSVNSGPGRRPMWEVDDPEITAAPGGNEPHYSSTPTPACIHNYLQKKIGNPIRNGMALKFVSRQPLHTAYHFAADLTTGQLERVTRLESLRQSIARAEAGLAGRQLSDALRARFLNLAREMDDSFARRRAWGAGLKDSWAKQRTELEARFLHPTRLQPIADLPEDERKRWTLDVEPGLPVARTDDLRLAELYAYAHALLRSGQVRTVALEWDYIDFHGTRDNVILSLQAQQTAIPLARLIEKLKADGLWHKTLIAIYALDGSRSPHLESYGDEGKGAVVLAGGMIRGGYYGDIRIAGTEEGGYPQFSYHRPDLASGQALNEDFAVGRDQGKRLPGAVVWKTVSTALGVPEALQNRYPDVAAAAPLRALLRG